MSWFLRAGGVPCEDYARAKFKRGLRRTPEIIDSNMPLALERIGDRFVEFFMDRLEWEGTR